MHKIKVAIAGCSGRMGKALLEVSRTAAQTGLYVPTELTLLGKTLLQLEEVGKTLCPKFNPNASVRQHVAEIMTTRMRKTATTSLPMKPTNPASPTQPSIVIGCG